MIFSGVGRLVRDCETRFTPSGTSVCSFTIACNDNFKKEKTHFFNCVSFGKQGEVIAKYFGKGSKIYVYGFLKQESWTDSTGNKKSAVCLHVDGFEFVDSKKDAGITVEAIVNKFIGTPVDSAPSFNDEDIPF